MHELSDDIALRSAFKNLQSPAMQNIAQTVERIAPSDLNVLLVGGSGTGKTWSGRIIHRLSHRGHKRIMEIDCSTVPSANLEEFLFGYEAYTRGGIEINRGILEEASGGTIFLKEIAHLPSDVQKKVAHVLENQSIRRNGGREEVPVNVRFIGSLNRKPDVMLEEGLLRRELFYRISPIIINLPPLRERREDIPLLIEDFLCRGKSSQPTGTIVMNPDAINVCLGYDWPGNLRQLQSAVEYALMMCRGGIIQPEHLPLYVHGWQTAAVMESRLRSVYATLNDKNRTTDPVDPIRKTAIREHTSNDSMMDSTSTEISDIPVL